jgi:divalent metal cation (Fe/Co/Zn/Cd) transporter
MAGWTLWSREAPGESVLGIILAAASLVITRPVTWRKLRAAKAINSAALRSEAKETLACSYLGVEHDPCKILAEYLPTLL